MRFRSYDSLRLFDVVARHGSFTTAARELNLSKGAVSYQVGRLESELGFKVFTREHRRITLTEKGNSLWLNCTATFQSLEREIARLRADAHGRITIAMSSYFASRWLSPRLATFITEHPQVGLRLQPLLDLVDLESESINMAIRWGNGEWSDMTMERLLTIPAFPTAAAATAKRVKEIGLRAAMADLVLLHDRDGSSVWRDWHRAAGLPYHAAHDALIIPDPNVRVHAVINEQGIALNDSLVQSELESGALHKISSVELTNYGYFLAYKDDALDNPSLRAFHNWIVKEAHTN